jgi:D-alanine-D-alanine ligase-like ATP-grasp enzyme
VSPRRDQVGRSGPRTTAMLSRLARHGKPGAALGLEMDLFRELGPRLFLSQRRSATEQLLAGDGRRAVYGRIWEQAADEVGAELEEDPPGYLTLRRAQRRTRVFQQLVPLDDPVVLRLAGDKPVAHQLLARAGVPVPEHRAFRPDDLEGASAFVAANGPCVVKPANASGAGNGVTGGVRTRLHLQRALLRAVRYDPDWMLLERQATGDEYRVLVLDGDPIGIVRRRPPHVRGDGHHTVVELVERENDRRAGRTGEAGLWPLRLDLDAVLALEHQGLGLRSVPAAGRAVKIHHGTSEGSERDATVVDVDDPRVAGARAAAVRAVTALGCELGSVELITPTAEGDLTDAGGVVIEVNTTPGLAQHYLVDNPDEVVPVAAPILQRLLGSG